MRIQKLMPIKNIAQINELLATGWSYQYNVGDKHIILEKYQNREQDVPYQIGDAQQPLLRRG
jgi:hypothetical protein